MDILICHPQWRHCLSPVILCVIIKSTPKPRQPNHRHHQIIVIMNDYIFISDLQILELLIERKHGNEIKHVNYFVFLKTFDFSSCLNIIIDHTSS